MTNHRVQCVVCCYELTPAQVDSHLRRIGARMGVDFYGYMVDNQREIGTAVANWIILSGSNSLMDFSAYVEGARALGVIADNEAFMFFNDTLFTRHNAHFQLYNLYRYVAYVGELLVPCIAGKTDSYSNIIFANPWSGINTYVSTYAFLVNKGAIAELLAAYDGVKMVMGDELSADSAGWSDSLDMGFREFLRAHLFLPGTPTAWYQAHRYAGNTTMLRQKARCVYLEHKVSGEIGKRGIIVALYPRARDKSRFSFYEKLAKIRRQFLAIIG